jgi:uncharacterized protein YggE
MEITVAGTGSASLRPERATIHLTAGFEGPEPQGPMAATTDLVRRLSAELARLKGADPSPTTWSAVLPIRTRSWRPFSDKGTVPPPVHAASAQVQVKFRDVGALARFVDAWGGVDGVTIVGVRWTLTEATRQDEERRVLARAVEQARERARVIAAAAGAGDVRVVEVADPGLLGGDRHGTSAPSAVAGRPAAEAARAALAPVDLAPEDVELSAVVHARFVTAD